MIYESTNKYKFVYVQELKPKIKLNISVLNIQKKILATAPGTYLYVMIVYDKPSCTHLSLY